MADEWQAAPAEHLIINTDEYKIKYRQEVEAYINQFQKKSIRRKQFITIAVNVLCADTKSSASNIPSFEKDLYLPLEIALVKWNIISRREPVMNRVLDSKVWMINPGSPPSGSINAALDHRKVHKINYGQIDLDENPYIDKDLTKVAKEMNSFLTPDRVLFSLNLRQARQDLGSLKWLNREIGHKLKPIKILSLQDLYVVLIRYFNPDVGRMFGTHSYGNKIVCQGLVAHKVEDCSSLDTYDPDLQCYYHRTTSKQGGEECNKCAKALALSASHIVLEDIVKYGAVFQEQERVEDPAAALERLNIND